MQGDRTNQNKVQLLLQALLGLQNLHVRKNGGELSVDGRLDVESVLTALVKNRQS